MKARYHLVWTLAAILALLVLSGCDAVVQRAGLSATAVAQSSQMPVDDITGENSLEGASDGLPEGEGIGGGALEDVDPAALATAIQLTVEALVTNTSPAEPTATPTATATPGESADDEPTPTVPAAAFTQLAQTLTAIVVTSTPTATPNASISPTVSGTPPTAQGTVLAGTGGSATPTRTPTPSGPCLALRFVADVNYPDGSAVQPRQIFFKQWYIQNIGTCRWDADYSIVYHSGDALGARNSYNMGVPIYPGQYVTISAQMVAPDLAGYYTSYWGLQDDDGNFFGFTVDNGANYDQPFYVQVYVLGASLPQSSGGGSGSSGGGVVVTAPPFTPGP
jgi:hypothetical protein